MNSFASNTLAQIVTGNYRTATVFEKYHLDFCCKGKRSLAQACAEQDLPLDNLVGELESVFTRQGDSCQAGLPFDKLGLSQLADYIVNTHHAFVRAEMLQIPVYVEKIAAKHGQRHPELLKVFQLVVAIKEEMDLHMEKEELILFPRIKEIEQLTKELPQDTKLNLSYLESPITVMEQEHDHAGTIMSEIRALTNDFTAPADACTTYRLAFAALRGFEADLHHHVHLENNILFPKAIELLKTLKKTTLN